MDCGQRMRRRWSCVLLCLAAGFAAGVDHRASAQPLSHEFAKVGKRLRAAFRPVVADARRSVVRVRKDDQLAALGIVVSADGMILTKASEIHGELTIEMPDGTEAPALLIGIDRETDVALLRTAAEGLEAVAWAEEPLPVGSWIASAGPGRLPVGVGIVGLAKRDVDAQRGMLGIELGADDAMQRPMVVGVFPGSGAARAGLREGDIILMIAGESVPDRQSLLDRLANYRPGDALAIQVRRGEETEQVDATLSSDESIMYRGRRPTMAGPLSTRTGGFDNVIQHDTFLDPHLCGGPIVNLDGQVVGMNIARAGRIETYALPTSEILPILERLQKKDPQTAHVTTEEP